MKLEPLLILWLSLGFIEASLNTRRSRVLPSARRYALAVRGGGSPDGDWVCDGDTCSFVPKAKASTAVATKSKNATSISKPRGGAVAVVEKKSSKKGGSKKAKKSKGVTKPAPRTFLQRALDYVLSFFGIEPPASTSASDDSEEESSKPGGSSKSAAKTKGKKAGKPAAKMSRAAQRKAAGRAGGSAASRSSSALRIQRELRDFQTNGVPNIAVAVSPTNMNVWVVTLTGVEGTLFAGEKFKLRVEFPKEYPTRPPSVYFLKPTPRHQHVYTNGDICLDLLGKGWRPQLTTKTLAISILSMLSSAREKGLPPDNANRAFLPAISISFLFLYCQLSSSYSLESV